MERKGGIPRKRDNEIKVSNLSDIEFKIIGVRMLKELSGNKNSMKKDINYEQEP